MSAEDNTQPAAVYTADAVVLAPDGDQLCVLLIRRAADHDTEPGKWALPGGHVDPGETAAYAAYRELREETGLDLCAMGAGLAGLTWLTHVGRYDEPGRDPRGHYITDAFIVRLSTTMPVTGMDDADLAEWVPVDEARTAALAFDHGLILRDAVRCAGLPVTA